MKHILSIIVLFMLSSTINAQPKICPLNDGMLHEVFVFSENRNHTIMELFGERVNPMVINIVYITSTEAKKKMEEQILSGEMRDGTFIFPSSDATKTIRYCNTTEYATALKKNENAEIEKLQSTDK